MTYTSEVLADSPWGFWALSETQATAIANGSKLTDASGNARPLSIGNTDSSSMGFQQPGPASDALALSFPAGPTDRYTFAPLVTTSPVTVEVWVKVTALDPDGHLLMGFADSARTTTDKNLYLRGSDGKLVWHCYNGANQHLAASTALTLGTWHHVVASVGAAGQKLRVDGVTVASNPAVTVSYAGGAMFPFVGTGGQGTSLPVYSAQGARTIAMAAVWLSQLTDTRTDAHRAAMLSTDSRSATLSGTLPRPTAAVAGTSTPPGVAAALSGGLPRLAGTFTGTRTPAPAVATLAAPLPNLQGSVVGHVQTYEGLAAVLPALAGHLNGVTQVVIGTDTTYANDSYTYGGTAQVDYDTPVAAPPPGLVRRDVRRVHQSLPTPDLVRGRPQ